MARAGKQGAGGSLIELVVIVAVALGVALAIQALLVKPFRIPSESMVPTLEVGQRVLVDRVSLRFGDPERGDVMVFKPPKGADTNSCGESHSAGSTSTASSRRSRSSAPTRSATSATCRRRSRSPTASTT